MIIDLILDRKDGFEYDPKDFYNDVMHYESESSDNDHSISRAMDSGTEADVKKALCDYVKDNGYNLDICKYINSVKWLDNQVSDSKKFLKGLLRLSDSIKSTHGGFDKDCK